MDAGIAALLGAIIGGIASWAGAWSVEVRRDKRQGRSLALAAASEIDATLMMLKARNWRGHFQDAQDIAISGEVFDLKIHVRDDYLPMCRAAMSHAGVINRDLSVLLARLITLSDSLIADLQRLAAHPSGTPDALIDAGDAKYAAKFYGELIEIIDAGFFVGSEIVTMVNAMYPKSVDGLWTRLKGAANMLRHGTTNQERVQ